MPEIKILTETDLRRIVHLDLEAIDCIESAFKTLAGGQVVMPPILSMAIPDFNGEVDVKTAYVPGIESFAIKMSPGFFDNPKLGLPSTSGLMILFSARTGMVEALLLDNGYLTDIRTAAAGAVAARHLARADAKRACIIGAGSQGKLQLQALALVRPISAATIWDRNGGAAAEAARDLSEKLGFTVTAGTAAPGSDDELAASVSAADIIVTTTPSASPVLKSGWLRPGQHVTAMGSDQPHKNELEPACLARAALYVPDRRAQTERLGELHHALEAGIIAPDRQFPELGEIAAGTRQGRPSDDAITICDLTGTGVQDTAIATFARRRAAAAEIGADFTT